MGTSFADFISNRPGLQHVFFGGKGGVGKTVIATGAAYYFAEELGRRTLILSTNPIHSLSSAFAQDIWGKGVCRIEGLEKLYAIESETADIAKIYRRKLKERVISYIKGAGIPIYPKLLTSVDRAIGRFAKVTMTNPAFEEAAMFDYMIDFLLREEFDIYVFDTAPVALTYRLFKTSKAYDFWLRRLVKSIEVKPSWREKILRKIKKDPLFVGLLSTRERTERGRELLSDKDRTAFFFVTLPLALPIAVTWRFIGWIQDSKISVGGVIVNQVLPKEQFDLNRAPSFVANKIKEQDRYLEAIRDRFSGLVRACVPLLDADVQGTGALAKVAEALRDRESLARYQI